MVLFACGFKFFFYRDYFFQFHGTLSLILIQKTTCAMVMVARMLVFPPLRVSVSSLPTVQRLF